MSAKRTISHALQACSENDVEVTIHYMHRYIMIEDEICLWGFLINSIDFDLVMVTTCRMFNHPWAHPENVELSEDYELTFQGATVSEIDDEDLNELSQAVECSPLAFGLFQLEYEIYDN